MIVDASGEVTFRHHVHAASDTLSLSNNTIVTIEDAGDGALWVGTLEGGLNRLNPSTEQFTRFEIEGSNRRDVARVLMDSGGVLWVATFGGGVSRLDPRTLATDGRRRYQLGSRAQGRAVRVLQTSADGTIWAGTAASGLVRIERRSGARSSTMTFRNDPNDGSTLASDAVTALAIGPTGTVWVGTRHALQRMEPLLGQSPNSRIILHTDNKAFFDAVIVDKARSIAPNQKPLTIQDKL